MPEFATLSMDCFWSGEAAFDQVDGVVGTRTGVVEGRGMVEVTYHQVRLNFRALMKAISRS